MIPGRRAGPGVEVIEKRRSPGGLMDDAGERDRLLDVVDDAPMDEHANLVRRLLGCDGALVTVLDDQAQRFLGQAGLDGSARARRGTPLDRSLCRITAAGDQPLQVDDLGAEPSLRDHRARTELGVEAYLGVPLRTPSGLVVGAVCGLDHAPHAWTDRDLELLHAMRDLIQVELRPLLRATRDRARAEEVSLLLSTLRHELGGELAIVLGGIETAMLPGIDHELQQRVLGNARRDCRRVISTLDALLRMDGRAPIRLRDVELADVLDDVVTSAAARHDTRRIDVDVEPCALVTEPTLLEHVVRNLVDNACKYSQGAVQVLGGPHRLGAQVTVADEGQGLPEDVVTQLFEPFSRPRDDGGESGFGLGLYIIRTLCDRLDARLAVDTDQGGTRITVVVPDARQSPKPSNAASSSEGE